MKAMGLSVIAVSFIIIMQGCASSQSKSQPAAAAPPQGYSSAQHEKAALDDMNRTKTARAGADKNLEILMQKVKADKKLLVANNMDLTDGESRKFWPIYDEYQQNLQQINKRLGSTIVEYADAYNSGPLQDSKAEKLLNQVLDAEESEVKLKQSYAEKLEDVLPQRKVARYIQIENKIRAAVYGALAERIPLAY
jgi:hypothetical protein